jgi:hypothetical protein
LAPEVTILCATLNGGDVVRLTFSSLGRFTPEPYRILVADNGSTDSTLDYLRSLDWIELFKLGQHRTKTSHGATLDWLAKKVETRYLLTLDSDVAFLRHGWLGELSDTLAAQDLAAVGEFEPAVGAYRPRLAPHVLLLNTERFLALGTSFESCVRFDDSAEVRRWRGRSKSEYLSQEELNSYHSAAFYSTGAALFETVLRRGSVGPLHHCASPENTAILGTCRGAQVRRLSPTHIGQNGPRYAGYCDNMQCRRHSYPRYSPLRATLPGTLGSHRRCSGGEGSSRVREVCGPGHFRIRALAVSFWHLQRTQQPMGFQL